MTTLNKMNFKNNRFYLLIIILVFQGCQAQDKKNEKDIETIQNNATATTSKVSYTGIVDFRNAARLATPGVVNIKCTFKSQRQQLENGDQTPFYNLPDPLKEFFGDDPFFRQFKLETPNSQGYQSMPLIGSASGVILTEDGYIVTNNHVVKGASEINITLSDGRSYEAKLIGADPLTDLALLKIEEKKLSFIRFGESDDIEVGEWVVAVGNPFNLASTVTAGIVSAKARNINILRDQGAIESFIQTDAAVNPGNSGGALVTLEGKLIGINTAIATPTGVYAGYAFAIPVDIVKKVTNDLMNYGLVERGVLGISIRDLNSSLAKEIKIDRANGVYVDDVIANGAAAIAGVKAKDVIIGIDDIETVTASKLQEIVMRKRPGEKVKISLIRNGNEKKELTATLQKPTEISSTPLIETSELLKELGVDLVEINAQDRKNYNVKNGLKVIKLYDGKLKSNTDIKEGFVITSVNRKPVNTVKAFVEAVRAQQGGIMLEGKYAGDSAIYYYAFGI
ncbi:trypsin-like peptidase domain-containing protein [Flavobacterium degerlachei]|jgi:Do/DeqQ family serine protease|uniref:Do/DeqQ family serine protease n=1 Tax=Flavobacterium degerlachei TaxID=229203 RepID=A0A1H2SSU4_9FLAO|nr:trypsin-like peptidase domain-containing protein [Flavobacterium degerlachei]SDW34119.1 Do/DeqQ family serine protease [Flavobacterium degerlachei]